MGKRMTYITIYTELTDVIDQLQDESAGRLLKSLLHHATGDDVHPTGEERLVYKMMAKQIDQHAANYDQVCEKRRAAGAAGAAVRWSKQQQTMASDSNCYQMPSDAQQTVANMPKDKDKVKAKDNDKVNVKQDIPAANRKRFSPPTLQDVQTYCRERGNSVDAQRWFDYYSSNGWMVGKNHMKDWRAAVRTWEKNQYSQPRPAAQPRVLREQQYHQREYEASTGMPDWMKEMMADG